MFGSMLTLTTALSVRAGPQRWVAESWCYELARTQFELLHRFGSVAAALRSMTEGRYELIEV